MMSTTKLGGSHGSPKEALSCKSPYYEMTIFANDSENMHSYQIDMSDFLNRPDVLGTTFDGSTKAFRKERVRVPNIRIVGSASRL